MPHPVSSQANFLFPLEGLRSGDWAEVAEVGGEPGWVARLAELSRGAAVPILHSMMGTLPGRAEWFATLESAGVPVFDDVEAMAECAGLLARYPRLRAHAATGGDAPIRVRGQRKA